MSLRFLIPSVVLLHQLASAQAPPNSAPAGAVGGAPRGGIVFDARSHALQPILGLPGAALLGRPLDAGLDVALAVTLPGQQAVLAVASSDGRVWVLKSDGDTVAKQAVDGAMLSPGLLAVSPKGAAAALYDSSSGALQAITGLSGVPAMASQWDASAAAGAIRVLAVSDDARAIVAATPDQVWLFESGADPRQLPVAAGVSALSFQPGSHDALAAGPGFATLLRSLADQPQYRALDVSLGQPVAAEFSADGARAFIADRQSSGVIVVALDGSGSASVACECSLAGFFRLSDSTFAIADGENGRVTLFDSGSAGPRTWFLPPDTGDTASTTAAAGGVE